MCDLLGHYAVILTGRKLQTSYCDFLHTLVPPPLTIIMFKTVDGSAVNLPIVSTLKAQLLRNIHTIFCEDFNSIQ